MDVRLATVPELARLCHDETTKYLRREPSREPPDVPAVAGREWWYVLQRES